MLPQWYRLGRRLEQQVDVIDGGGYEGAANPDDCPEVERYLALHEELFNGEEYDEKGQPYPPVPDT